MNVDYTDSPDSFALKAHLWLESRILAYHATSLFLPAGQTPKPLYQFWENQQPKFLSQLQFFQVDEIVSGSGRGMFHDFFKENLPSQLDRLKTPSESDGKVASLGILGLGQNGHVAFHEPHLPSDFLFGEVELEDSTCQNLKVEVGTRALTYGVEAFLQTEALLLLVSGDGKEKVFQDFISCRGDQPVNQLLEHSDLTVIAMDSFQKLMD